MCGSHNRYAVVVTIFTNVESNVVLNAHGSGTAAAADYYYYEIYRLAKGQIEPINFPQKIFFFFRLLGLRHS